MIDQDVKFVESVLPTHYRVQESATKGSVHCVSRTGMIKPGTGSILCDLHFNAGPPTANGIEVLVSNVFN